MNPFDLGGGEFIVFYAVVGAAVLALAYALRPDRRTGDSGAAPIDPTDPYAIAFLRAGANEALRIATLSLVDRGLLVVDDPNDDRLEPGLRAGSDAREKVRRSIEKAIIDHFGKAQTSDSVFTMEADPALEQYRERLESSGLLSSAADRQARVTTKRLAWLALWLVAGARIVGALAAGRSNIEFLVVLAALFSWAVPRVIDRPRTAGGDRALAELRALFSGLRDRVDQLTPGGVTNEMALTAAVYGVGTLPDLRFPFVRKLYRRATVGRSSAAACGSGCGGGGGWGGFSFGSGGDGGGDGGNGGCGGGCGGCGL